MHDYQPMVIHYVHDMDRALGFYRRVLERSPTFQSPGWSTFAIDRFTLALHVIHEGMSEAPLPHAGLNLMVEHIETTAERITTAGGTMLSLREPDDFVPVRVAEVRDCEGNGFELRQEIKD